MRKGSNMGHDVYTFLEHHGVKGQKWGVRNDKGHEGKKARTKKISKLDKKFERGVSDVRTMIKVNNMAAEKCNKIDVPKINNKPQYKNADFTRDTPLRQKYYKEHQDAWVNRLEEAANSLGTNASGTKKYGIIDHGDMRWEVTLRDIKHDGETIQLELTTDSTGHIIEIQPIAPLIQSGMDVTEAILSHHGVKGQKWGVRRKRSDRSASGKESKTKKKSQQQSQRFGKEAKRLSDKELNARIKRMELEKKYNDLNSSSKTSSEGKSIASRVLKNVGEQTSTRILNDVAYYTGKKAIEYALSKKMGKESAASVAKDIFPKKK